MGLRNDILFDLKSPPESSYLSGLLSFDYLLDGANVPNTPCLVDKHTWEKNDLREVLVKFPFPRHRGFKPNESTMLEKKHVVVNNKPAFIYKNRIKVIESFDFDRVVDLQDYVDRNAAITFQIHKHPLTAFGYNRKKMAEATAKSTMEFLMRMGKELFSRYKYSSSEFCYFEENYKGSTGNLSYFLTFISLPNCIPIFNHKRARGVSLIIRAVKERETEINHKLHCAGQIALLLMDHLDNKFVVDGITLSGVDPLQSSTLHRFAKIVKANSGSNNKEKECVKKSEVDSGDFITVEGPSFYYTMSSSSSTTTYS